ncbi:hypothetical protein AGMMS50239_24480 [Bacteroidia bacterium]|nr:hypothetical protein AGMMS50239_24480 [Bacteroidia bacterium]
MTTEILVSTITAITVFFLGEVFVWFRNKKQAYNDTKTHKETILNWITFMESPITDQTKELESFIEKIKTQDIYPQSLGTISFLADKVDNLPLESYILTFIINSKYKKGKKEKHTLQYLTHSIINQFRYLVNMEIGLKESFRGYKQYFENLTKEWFIYWQQLSDFLKDNSLAMSKECLDYLKAIKNTTVNEKHNIKELEPIINSIIELTVKEMHVNPQNKYAFSFYPILQQVQKIIIDWTVGVRNYSKSFEYEKDKMLESYNSLKKTKEYLENDTKLRWVFNIRTK